MSRLPGKFVWFELVCADARKAQAFYGEVLGWKVESFPMGETTYEMIKAGDSSVGGYTAADHGAPAHWISYVSVADVDASARKVKAAGGKILAPAIDVPGVGRMQRVADPQGGELYLFTSAQDDAADGKGADGTVHWNELLTSDPDAAVGFYTKVLGYTDNPKDMGPIGTYHVLEHDGVPRAGVVAAPKGAPTHWMPYVQVGDCDQALARARKLGAEVLMEAQDIPGVGRFAALRDPTGAAIAIIKPAAA